MKKGRRQKKGASKRRRGGNKGQKGGKRSKGRPTARRDPRSSTVAGTCFESAIFYMKLWKDVVGNFEKQRKRMIKQNKTGGNKSGKKGLFAPIGHRLVDIGGGNKSNMSCGGQYGNKGAAQLQNLTKTLFDCEKSVNASCNPSNFPQPNFTFINTCKELVDNFTKVATTCLGKSVGGSKTNNTDACTCWSGEMLNMTSQTLKNCKANKESSAITSALKACTTAFGKCRKSRATATSCSEIITISTTIVKIVEQNPQSTKISTYAKKISSATVTCTAAEKTAMAAQVTSMETAIVSVSVVLTAIQEQIETLTGSTASATQLDAAASGETSTAAPGRRNRILNNLMKHQI